MDSNPHIDENGIPEVTKKDVVKEGYLSKQSRYLKDWRRYCLMEIVNIV